MSLCTVENEGFRIMISNLNPRYMYKLSSRSSVAWVLPFSVEFVADLWCCFSMNSWVMRMYVLKRLVVLLSLASTPLPQDLHSS